MKVNVLTPRFGGPFINGRDLVSTLNKRGIVVKHTHKLKDLLMSPLHQSADVVHAMGIPVTYRVWRKPVVITILADYRMEGNIWRFFFPKAIEKADVVTTTSRFLKKRLELEDAIVIPNAVVLENFNPVKHEEKKTIKLECTVVGGGHYLEEMKSEVRKDVEIDFVGFKRDPRKIMEGSDIFAYYSGHDNFPTVLLEAMACGLPVVTNEVGAVSEVITSGEDGYVAKDDDDYLAHLLNLLEDYKLRRRIGQNARKTVEKKFNWETVINNFVSIYNFLITKSG